jgi:hypothetical protein
LPGALITAAANALFSAFFTSLRLNTPSANPTATVKSLRFTRHPATGTGDGRAVTKRGLLKRRGSRENAETRRTQSGEAATEVITAEYAERKAARFGIPRIPRIPRFIPFVRHPRGLRANWAIAVQREIPGRRAWLCLRGKSLKQPCRRITGGGYCPRRARFGLVQKPGAAPHI